MVRVVDDEEFWYFKHLGGTFELTPAEAYELFSTSNPNPYRIPMFIDEVVFSKKVLKDQTSVNDFGSGERHVVTKSTATICSMAIFKKGESSPLRSISLASGDLEKLMGLYTQSGLGAPYSRIEDRPVSVKSPAKNNSTNKRK